MILSCPTHAKAIVLHLVEDEIFGRLIVGPRRLGCGANERHPAQLLSFRPPRRGERLWGLRPVRVGAR